MKKMVIAKLPDDCTRAICEFLRVESTPGDHGKNKKNIQTNLRAFLDSCTRLRELKLSEVGMWHFKREYAEQYRTDETFRARVYEALAMPDRDGNPQQQLPIGMNLSKSRMTDGRDSQLGTTISSSFPHFNHAILRVGEVSDSCACGIVTL